MKIFEKLHEAIMFILSKMNTLIDFEIVEFNDLNLSSTEKLRYIMLAKNLKKNVSKFDSLLIHEKLNLDAFYNFVTNEHLFNFEEKDVIKWIEKIVPPDSLFILTYANVKITRNIIKSVRYIESMPFIVPEHMIDRDLLINIKSDFATFLRKWCTRSRRIVKDERLRRYVFSVISLRDTKDQVAKKLIDMKSSINNVMNFTFHEKKLGEIYNTCPDPIIRYSILTQALFDYKKLNIDKSLFEKDVNELSKIVGMTDVIGELVRSTEFRTRVIRYLNKVLYDRIYGLDKIEFVDMEA